MVGETTSGRYQSGNVSGHLNGKGPSRNPFPDSPWFAVPLWLHESGLASKMSGSEFKRYVTLLRISNFDYGNRKMKFGLKELEKLDGVSSRSAFQVHTRLQEYGMLEINRRTRPHTYTLRDPDSWTLPDLQLRQFQRTGKLQIKKVYPPIPWDNKEAPLKERMR